MAKIKVGMQKMIILKNSVCLNKKGKTQSRTMDENIKNINLPISYVISSASCRSRQKASLVFGGYDSMSRLLVHEGPYNENNK